MIIWNGLGFLVFVFVFGCSLVANLIVNAATGSDTYWEQHKWPFGLSLLFAAALSWFVGHFLAARKQRTLIDKATGEEIVVKSYPALFFIRMHWWGPILAATGIILLVMGIFGWDQDPNLKKTKTYTGAGLEFQYPGNWKVSQNQNTHGVILETDGFVSASLFNVPSSKGTSNRDLLSELVDKQTARKSTIERIILSAKTQGIRTEYDVKVDDVTVSMRTEYFVAGPEERPTVVIIQDSSTSWDKDFAGFEAILESLKQK